MKTSIKVLFAFCALAASDATAAVRYVSVNSASPAAPYATWATAARTIQEAVNAAEAGDLVLVTNGIYQTGGQATDQSNRVAITKALTVQSVNGPSRTVIHGLWDVRCVWLTNGAVLAGFTLTNGVSYTEGGGAYGGTLSNCTLLANGAYDDGTDGGGGAARSTLYQCVIANNYAFGFGAGAMNCTLRDCIVTNNFYATDGGGAYNCSLSNCVVSDNSLYSYGQGTGVAGCALNKCTILRNNVDSSTATNCTFIEGGAIWSTLTNCSVLSGGYAASSKLFNCSVVKSYGVYESTLRNCFLTGTDGYAALNSTLTNCTLVGNSSGAFESTLYNCIAYYNGTENYDSSSTLRYCCTTPLPAGPGNFSSDPQLADPSHISANSPCRGAGNAAYARGVDIDGEAWLNPPSLGCDEFVASSATGAITIVISADYTNVAVGFPAKLSVQMTGHASSNYWDMGDGTIVPNRPAPVAHSWARAGVYTVIFRAFNDPYPSGISASVTIRVVQNPVQYVSLLSTNPVSPYTNWTTAAKTIQHAINAGFAGGTILVTNGAYGTSNTPFWQVTVDRPITIQSVNGPAVTTINGYRTGCVSMATGAALSGFTVRNGQGYSSVSCGSTNSLVTNCVITECTGNYGVMGGTLINCQIVSNAAYTAASGANLIGCILASNITGADYSTLSNCLVIANQYGASSSAAINSIFKDNASAANQCRLKNCGLTSNNSAASSCVATNCTITGNYYGVSGGSNYNSIIYYNSVYNYDGSGGFFDRCVTTPLPSSGIHNFTNEPLLTDALHLSPGSPCVAAGKAAYATGVDIDGEPWANPPSIGCDQYYVGAISGPLSVSLKANFTNVITGFVVNFESRIDGHASFSFWDFDDGTFIFDQPFGLSHAFSAPGDYNVRLVAYNNSYPAGVVATVPIHVLDNPVQYVAANSTNPVAPYLSWATAATNIQHAIDHAFQGGLILVSNGVYNSGSRVMEGYYPYPPTTNRIVITTPVQLRSVNGPLVTTIDGEGKVWCAGLVEGASLSGFTLTRGLGGVQRGALSNCIIAANLGDGAENATLVNCVVSANGGYGVLYGSATNCTVTANEVGSHAPLYNCILYYNRTNYDEPWFDYTCTTPALPEWGNNISEAPKLTDSIHLAPDSPCRGAGQNGFASKDFDGQPWLMPSSIGCDEFYSTSPSGPLNIVLSSDHTHVAVGFAVNFTGAIFGHASSNRLDFGDGATVASQYYYPFHSHSWSTPGDYAVVLRAFNETYPGGIASTVLVHVVAQPVHHVALGSTTPLAPYTNWATAATNIQQAVDAATVPGSLVLVSNGVYQSGSRTVAGISNRVAVAKPITLQSVNGAASTIIQGGRQVRCIYLTNAAMLVGFTLTNATFPTALSGIPIYGAGVYGGTLSNCTIVANTNSNSYGSWGGGAYGATLVNCILTRNSAGTGTGGGAHTCTLISCTLSNNSAGYFGGGAFGGSLINCFLSGNRAFDSGGGAAGTQDYYSPSAVVMINCVLTNNNATYGGGVHYGSLLNCTLVDNVGFYGGGANTSWLTNCVLSGNRAPAGEGGGAYGSVLVSCELTNNLANNGGADAGSELYNCTLSRNYATNAGGAAYFSFLNRCLVTANVATNSGGGLVDCWAVHCTIANNWARYGGGAVSCALESCLLTGNIATNAGGGAYNCELKTCTVTGNAASNSAGGIALSSAYGSIVYYNQAPTNANFYHLPFEDVLQYCCTTPLPTNSIFETLVNITNQPGFINVAGGDLRLQSNSPCINSGGNFPGYNAKDLDGNARIAGGTVDIGAYEFQSPGSSLSYAWLQKYGLATDGTADFADSDGDHLNNYQEWRAFTSPINSLSLLRMLSVSLGTNGVEVSWQSVPGLSYVLERSTNLAPPTVFTPVSWAYPDTTTTSVIDPEPSTNGQAFYRVTVP